ncbi:uncharacterized protein [Prorops nasuta]|uniref:uncharacterized protein n=1 Tax=Prorops nasuta TaxID=863751 RepID=UPI0034CE26D6
MTTATRISDEKTWFEVIKRDIKRSMLLAILPTLWYMITGEDVIVVYIQPIFNINLLYYLPVAIFIYIIFVFGLIMTGELIIREIKTTRRWWRIVPSIILWSIGFIFQLFIGIWVLNIPSLIAGFFNWAFIGWQLEYFLKSYYNFVMNNQLNHMRIDYGLSHGLRLLIC